MQLVLLVTCEISDNGSSLQRKRYADYTSNSHNNPTMDWAAAANENQKVDKDKNDSILDKFYIMMKLITSITMINWRILEFDSDVVISLIQFIYKFDHLEVPVLFKSSVESVNCCRSTWDIVFASD